VLSVPLYPDPQGWYNLISDFSVNWDLPKDVISVATSVDKIPNTNPTKSEGLFDNKVFKALDNGVWYVHVRFKNNIGWGQTNHYRIAIDSVPPLPFEVVIVGNPVSDNPTPEIKFTSSDQFSGIQNYQILVDGQEEASINNTSYIFKPIFPNKHKIIVSAKDKAGNITDGKLDLEILPIQSPEILFINKNIFIGEGSLVFSGSSIPNVSVLADLKFSTGETVFHGENKSDDKGQWSFNVDQPLKKGNYYLEIRAKDDRGALSSIVSPEIIKVRLRPILVLGNLAITQVWFFIIFIFILIATFGAGWFSYYKWRGQLGRKVTIVGRDITNILDNSKKDVDKLIKNYNEGNPSNSDLTDMGYTLKNLKNYLEKSHRYAGDDIREIGS
ncbi:MAG: hypothetical protein WAV10_00360, partial [Minisyncoccia bacterium]